MLGRAIQLLLAELIVLLLLGCGTSMTSEVPEGDDSDGRQEIKAVASPSPSPEVSATDKTCGQPYWKGTVGGKPFVATADEVVYGKVGLFRDSAAKMHRAGVATTVGNLKDIGQLKTSRGLAVKDFAGIELLSVVGPFVTFKIETLGFLEGSPGTHEQWWLTVDMTKAKGFEPFSTLNAENYDVKGTADLREMFNGADLYEAIRTSPRIVKASESENANCDLLLRKWIGRLGEEGNRDERIPMDDGSSFVEYSFRHFVFYQREADDIIIRLPVINLAATGAYRDNYIEISLPISSVTMNGLADSLRGSKAFFAAEHEAVTRGCSTDLEFVTTL